MTSRSPAEARWSCLRRFAGLRVNLFRAMHDRRFFLAEDMSVVATRCGDYALAACVPFDVVFSYHYVADSSWYGCDLSRLADDDVPEEVQRELIAQFACLLG